MGFCNLTQIQITNFTWLFENVKMPFSDVLGLSPADEVTGSCLLDWWCAKTLRKKEQI